MDDKQQVEKHVARLFLERTEELKLSDADLHLGDPQKQEPDILYQDKGIEIGAVLRGTNTHIDIYEKEFVSRASEAVRGRIPGTLQIRLVMQDDRNTVEHTPASDFTAYRYLPKYLDGIFVFLFPVSQIDNQVVLNQKSRRRTPTFPSVQNLKEFNRFVDELVVYVNSLTASDFVEFDGCQSHHRMVTQGQVKPYPHDPLADFISAKILDKLRRNKYSGPYKVQILLLHNYSIIGNTEFSSDIHFYTHHRNDILNRLWQHITAYGSFDFYDSIYFLDFSIFALNSNFELLDFKDYSLREPSEFLYDYDEIRVDLGTLVIH